MAMITTKEKIRSAEPDKTEDNAADDPAWGYRKTEYDFVPRGQTISRTGRIKVSFSAWVIRFIFLLVMVLFIIFNIFYATRFGDPLIAYITVMPIHALLILAIGWIFFKTPAKGKVGDELVTVIIPAYNQEQLITKVIRAILKSTYPNMEIIAVNDGSKDNTGQVLDLLATEYPCLKVIHKANGGKRTAVAEGFKFAKGEYVVLIDSDSLVDKNAITEFVRAFKSDPKIGGVVGNGKVLNADRNLLTKCQDTWYDFSFNVHKSAESVFGTVLCLSGCLAAYRREAVARFMPYWEADCAQYGDDRNLTAYTIATPWAKRQLAPLERRLFKEMAGYDDAEDRSLTVQTFIQWKTVYVPTAIVYTEVPENWKTYLRQQIRWRKGYLRSTFFMSAFFWSKNPVMAFIFYVEFMMSFMAPLVTFAIFIYSPIALKTPWFPVIYLTTHLVTGLVAALDYKFRDPGAKHWLFKPVMNLVSALILPWVLFPALWSFKKNAWLTR
jgi:hyaluronan synthase